MRKISENRRDILSWNLNFCQFLKWKINGENGVSPADFSNNFGLNSSTELFKAEEREHLHETEQLLLYRNQSWLNWKRVNSREKTALENGPRRLKAKQIDKVEIEIDKSGEITSNSVSLSLWWLHRSIEVLSAGCRCTEEKCIFAYYLATPPDAKLVENCQNWLEKRPVILIGNWLALAWWCTTWKLVVNWIEMKLNWKEKGLRVCCNAALSLFVKHASYLIKLAERSVKMALEIQNGRRVFVWLNQFIIARLIQRRKFQLSIFVVVFQKCCSAALKANLVGRSKTALKVLWKCSESALALKRVKKWEELIESGSRSLTGSLLWQRRCRRHGLCDVKAGQS